MATYSVGTFLKDPSTGDRLMYIYNIGGQLTATLDPYTSTFFNKKKYVIVTDGKMNYDNVLDFETDAEGISAVARLNDVKKTFIDVTNNLLNNCGKMQKKISLLMVMNINQVEQQFQITQQLRDKLNLM